MSHVEGHEPLPHDLARWRAFQRHRIQTRRRRQDHRHPEASRVYPMGELPPAARRTEAPGGAKIDCRQAVRRAKEPWGGDGVNSLATPPATGATSPVKAASSEPASLKPRASETATSKTRASKRAGGPKSSIATLPWVGRRTAKLAGRKRTTKPTMAGRTM
jgi:hypothetical protein